jgi:hypothetical protein
MFNPSVPYTPRADGSLRPSHPESGRREGSLSGQNLSVVSRPLAHPVAQAQPNGCMPAINGREAKLAHGGGVRQAGFVKKSILEMVTAIDDIRAS